MQGRIHSLESFGTVDGPGVRFVVFFQGCPMRCKYCHNPDTWNSTEGTLTDSEDIIAKFIRNRPFYTTGGITATGGEPLMQLDFLIELFTLAKKNGIHTCLDTSGILFSKEGVQYDKFLALAKVTDLVMLDIKHMEPKAHKELTGRDNSAVFAFADFLEEQKISVWIRHVVVPGITDQEEELLQLGEYIKNLSNFEKLEILPYHSMGKVKYESLSLPYPLEGVPQLTKEEGAKAEVMVQSVIQSKGAK